MTPKEKARELYEKYISSENSLQIQLKLTGFTEIKRKGKKHSLIAVNEILDQLDEIINITGGNYVYNILDYWQEVEQEIGKL
jgi:hypothetical protein